MREKLIEILRKPIFPHELVDPIEAVADYLLDSGVIVADKSKATEPLTNCQQWIPVAERLPADDIPSKMYLCFWNGMIRVCKYWRTQKCFKLMGKDVKVTHWMPLPEPPKES
jgi:hypothetical protein